MPGHTFETFKDLGLQGTTFKPRVPPGTFTSVWRAYFRLTRQHSQLYSRPNLRWFAYFRILSPYGFLE